MGGKITTINNFKMAVVEVINDVSFKMLVPTLTASRTIDQERTLFLDLIKKSFNNPAISFAVEVDESNAVEIETPRFTNSRDRYEYIASLFPMVRQLKETLKLDVS